MTILEETKELNEVLKLLESSVGRLRHEAKKWETFCRESGPPDRWYHADPRTDGEDRVTKWVNLVAEAEVDLDQYLREQASWVLEENLNGLDPALQETSAQLAAYLLSNEDTQHSRLALSDLWIVLTPENTVASSKNNWDETEVDAKSLRETLKQMEFCVRGLGVSTEEKAERAIAIYRSNLMGGGLSKADLNKELIQLESMACYPDVCVSGMLDALRTSAGLCALLPEKLESSARDASRSDGSASDGSWSKDETISGSLVELVHARQIVASLLAEQVKIELGPHLFRIAQASSHSAAGTSDDEEMTEAGESDDGEHPASD